MEQEMAALAGEKHARSSTVPTTASLEEGVVPPASKKIRAVPDEVMDSAQEQLATTATLSQGQAPSRRAPPPRDAPSPQPLASSRVSLSPPTTVAPPKQQQVQDTSPLRDLKRPQSRETQQSVSDKNNKSADDSSPVTAKTRVSFSQEDLLPTASPVAATKSIAVSLPDHTQKTTHHLQWTLRLIFITCIIGLVAGFSPPSPWSSPPSSPDDTDRRHIIPPKPRSSNGARTVGPMPSLSTVTLRSFLTHNNHPATSGFSLAMAPAFFGFYGYFGVLAAWDEQLNNTDSTASGFLQSGQIRRLTGASAGAMAAVLLAAGIPPRVAADFCTTITLDRFADFPGLGGLFRGNLFEQIMQDFLVEQTAGGPSRLLLENAQLPVAVSAFDLQSLQGKILTKGSMARAARASATFPLLFEPVGWSDGRQEDFTLIDGGIADMAGLAALNSLPLKDHGDGACERIVNLKVGPFWGEYPPGPNEIDPDDDNDESTNASESEAEKCREVVSISIQNLPQCGPFAMEMGPVAVQAAHDAMVASLDLPLHVIESTSDNEAAASGKWKHYELHIDASHFWESK